MLYYTSNYGLTSLNFALPKAKVCLCFAFASLCLGDSEAKAKSGSEGKPSLLPSLAGPNTTFFVSENWDWFDKQVDIAKKLEEINSL